MNSRKCSIEIFSLIITGIVSLQILYIGSATLIEGDVAALLGKAPQKDFDEMMKGMDKEGEVY